MQTELERFHERFPNRFPGRFHARFAETLGETIGALLVAGLALCGACGRSSQLDTPPEIPLTQSPGPDYGAALRTAAIRLTGNLPTVKEIYRLKDAADPAATLNELIAEYTKRGMQPRPLREEGAR